MTIVYKLDVQGGFTAGDTETKLTSYAYPTSLLADVSKKTPLKAAHAMIEEQNWRKFVKGLADYDKRNWSRLEVSRDGEKDGKVSHL